MDEYRIPLVLLAAAQDMGEKARQILAEENLPLAAAYIALVDLCNSIAGHLGELDPVGGPQGRRVRRAKLTAVLPSVRVQTALKAAVTRLANARGLSVGAIQRAALHDYIDKETK